MCSQVKQRQDASAELADLRAQLSRALENENAYKVEQLSKQMIRLRRECALRISNMILLRQRFAHFACTFNYWLMITQQANAEKRLSAETRFKLETARAKADGKSLFGETPLAFRTHMQTRDGREDSHRYEHWENMTPRGGRGDGRDSTISQSPRSSPSASPAGTKAPKFGTAVGLGGAVGRSMRAT